jgi:hypothetical protein
VRGRDGKAVDDEIGHRLALGQHALGPAHGDVLQRQQRQPRLAVRLHRQQAHHRLGGQRHGLHDP